MVTLFISDLHLSSDAPEIMDIFLRFLVQEAKNAEALYILGDLFEVWVGDDAKDEFTQKICQALKSLANNVPVYIMSGNRDFLLGKRFAQECGATLLQDPTVITLYGVPTLLTHGDLLCTDDKPYQRWRRAVHSPWLQKIFLALPLTWRCKIAASLRERSKQHVSQLTSPIMDAVPSAIEAMLRDHQVTQIIHGHTHIPTIQYTKYGQFYAWRYVLSDWHHQGHALKTQAQTPFYLNKF